MGLNEIIQAVVPIGFMAIWAVTSILNRDAEPLPPRQGGGNPLGPTPPPPRPNRGGLEVLPDGTLRRPTPQRFPTGNSESRRPSVSFEDEDLVVVRPAPISRPNPVVTPLQARTRTRRQTVPKKPEKSAAQPLGGALDTNVSQHLKPIDLGNTSRPIAPIGDLRKAGTAAEVELDHRPRLDATISSLKDPKRLREAFVLNELLQPPLSIRNGLGTRRTPLGPA